MKYLEIYWKKQKMILQQEYQRGLMIKIEDILARVYKVQQNWEINKLARGRLQSLVK